MAELKNNPKNCDPLLLDNQLCFPLYVCAREVINAYTPFLDKIGLTYTQYITMMVMWEEKQVLTRHLRSRLRLDSGTLTPVIKRLEEKGFITKERSSQDARDLIVSITEKGEKLREEAVHIPEQIAVCVSGFTRGRELREILLELMDLFESMKK